MSQSLKSVSVSVEDAVALANATPACCGGFLTSLLQAAMQAGITFPAILAWVLTHTDQINKAVQDILAGAPLAVIVADLVALMKGVKP